MYEKKKTKKGKKKNLSKTKEKKEINNFSKTKYT